MSQIFYINCENSNYLIYAGKACLGIVFKDPVSKRWRISPEKSVTISDPIYKTRKSAVTALKKANYI